jgi:hypothetical protein
VKETIAGVPLGYSRDYDQLPLEKPLRSVRCQGCYRAYEDAERHMEDLGVCMAIMCLACREEARAQWIAAQQVKLPLAVAIVRRKSR